MSVRNARKDANEGVRHLIKEGLSEDSEKNAEIDIQELTDKYTHKLTDLLAAKEKEIMTI